MSYHYNEEYHGHSNQEVKRLRREILSHEKAIREAEEEIYKIQSECDHHYQLSSLGPYDDNYVCCLCGHDTEH